MMVQLAECPLQWDMSNTEIKIEKSDKEILRGIPRRKELSKPSEKLSVSSLFSAFFCTRFFMQQKGMP